MGNVTIRIPAATHEILSELSRQSGEPISDLVVRAVERLRRDCFLEATNRAFARLREDPQAWQEELGEREEWLDMTPEISQVERSNLRRTAEQDV